MGDSDKNICRICLVENNEKMQCVFDIIKCTGEPKQFSKMIMEFAKVEIFLGDDLPDQICFNCAQNTVKFYSFKTKCEESNKTLRNRLGQNPSIVIDEIEGDIFDKIKSEIKSENVEEVADVLKDISGLIENNQLETNVYEDYDACTLPKYKSLIGFNNKTTTNNTLSITQESIRSEENDVLHHNNVVQKASKIKMIDQTLDCEEYEINGKHKDKKMRITSEKIFYKCDNCKMRFLELALLTKHKCTKHTEKIHASLLMTCKRLNGHRDHMHVTFIKRDVKK